MKKFISTIVALMLGAALANVGQAAQGDKGFCYGTSGPQHLAKLVEESLAQDRTEYRKGTTKLNCPIPEGSHATPLLYLTAFNESLRQAGFKKRLNDVSEVPGFIRSMKVIPRPEGNYEVSCLRPLGNDKFKVVMDCLEREFEPNEYAWAVSEMQGDYEVDLVLVTSNCANVVNRKIILKITIIGGTPATPACEKSGLWAHAFSLADMTEEQRQKALALIASSNAIDTARQTRSAAYEPPRPTFSRVMGPVLRDVIPHAKVNEELQVNLRDPKTFKVVGTIGTISMVNGIGSIYPTNEQRRFIIETVWPDYFESPAHRRDGSDKRILLLYPEESWGRCGLMNISGALK